MSAETSLLLLLLSWLVVRFMQRLMDRRVRARRDALLRQIGLSDEQISRL